MGRTKPVVRRIKYRNIKSVDETVFADLLRSKSVYSDPADDVDEFADQLKQSVFAVLDELAPLNLRLVASAVEVNPTDGSLRQRLLPNVNGANSSGVGNELVVMRIESRTGRRVVRLMLTSSSHGGLSITNDSHRVLVTKEHNGRLCASCSTGRR